jgi:hypothetical protein
MRFLFKLLGLILLLAGVYFLGQNIYFSTNVYPYWWRGIAADGSILFLTSGILMLFGDFQKIKYTDSKNDNYC